MALYWHFRNKEELLTGLADQFWSEIDTDVDEAARGPPSSVHCWSRWSRSSGRTRAHPSC